MTLQVKDVYCVSSSLGEVFSLCVKVRSWWTRASPSEYDGVTDAVCLTLHIRCARCLPFPHTISYNHVASAIHWEGFVCQGDHQDTYTVISRSRG